MTVASSNKIGLPDFVSLGANCGLEVERPDPDPSAAAGAFERRARAASAVCARAVQDELDHRARRRRPATNSQLRALRAACDRSGLDLSGIVSERLGVEGPEALSVVEASRLIAELRTPSSAPPRKLQPGGGRT